MEVQLKKGLLEALVLAIIKKEDVYGYVLLNSVGRFIEVSESTLYPVLRRLEARKFLSTYQLEYNGRLRKYYRLTSEGVLRLNEYKKNLKDVKEIIEVIFENGKQL